MTLPVQPEVKIVRPASAHQSKLSLNINGLDKSDFFSNFDHVFLFSLTLSIKIKSYSWSNLAAAIFRRLTDIPVGCNIAQPHSPVSFKISYIYNIFINPLTKYSETWPVILADT